MLLLKRKTTNYLKVAFYYSIAPFKRLLIENCVERHFVNNNIL